MIQLAKEYIIYTLNLLSSKERYITLSCTRDKSSMLLAIKEFYHVVSITNKYMNSRSNLTEV